MIIEFRPTPNWWYQRHGLLFDRELYANVRRYKEQADRMERLLYERFGDIGLGQAHPNICPQVIDPEMIGLADVLGIPVHYYEAQTPQVDQARIDDEAMNRYEVPDFEKNEAFRRICRQVKEVKERYGLTPPVYTGSTGVLNLAVKMRGWENLSVDFFEQPERLKKFLGKLCDTIFRWSVLCRQAGHTPPDAFFATAHCCVPLVSLDIYRRFLLEHDLKLATLAPKFCIHQDLALDTILDEYAKIPNIARLNGRWDTNWEKLRRLFPKVDMVIFYGMERFKELNSAHDVYQDVLRVLRPTGFPPKQLILRLSQIEHNVSDELVRAAFRASRDWKKTCPKYQKGKI